MYASSSQQIQDHLVKIGSVIKQQEENLTFLKAQMKQLHDSIVDMQVRLGKYHSSSTINTEADELCNAPTDKDIIDQIMKHRNSAAGVLCEMQVHKCLSHSSLSLIEDDVVGIVATLGRVDDEKLSRLLSEYLGLDTMLAIVCKSYDGVRSLEEYDKEGSVKEDSGMHLFGSYQGKTLNGRFEVICLENLRAYPGGFVAEDPQKRLEITKPTHPNGETLAGFLGFAVNLIKVDADHLSCITTNGCGIRETLFYNLFSRLQIYRTRSDMLNALPFITDGAISLDGGMIRSNGRFSLGKREDVDVRFPKALDIPLEIVEIEKQMKQQKWEKERLEKDMWREQSMLDQAKCNFQEKKQELVKLLAERAKQCNGSQDEGAHTNINTDECVNEGAHSEDVHQEVISMTEATCTPLPNVPDVDVGNSPTFKPVDYSSDFRTNLVWPNRDSLLAWAREVAKKRNMVLTIRRSWLSNKSRYGKVVLTCERYGCGRKRGNYKEGGESRAKRSKKCNCPFVLNGYEVERNEWHLEVECGYHNHDIPTSLEGHAYVGRLNEQEYLMVKDLLASRKTPMMIHNEIKSKSPTNLTSRQQIYNAMSKLRREAVSGRTTTIATFDSGPEVH